MYTAAAILYIVCAVLFCVYTWWATRPWFGMLKSCTRLWVALFLFIPSQVDETHSELSPAFMKVLFTFLTDGWSAASPHATPLIAALAIATTVIVSVAFVNWVRRPKDDDQEKAA